MADNVVVTAGTGTTIAADEVSEGTLGVVKVQYVKLMDGSINGTNLLVITAGGAMKVDGSAVTQPVSGTVTASGPLTDAQLRAVAVPVSGAVTVSGTASTTPGAGLGTVATGELAGSTSAVQNPSVACKLVRFKAVASNTGKVYVGVAGVTKVDGTTDTTSGLELQAGDDTGWIPISNVNLTYRISDGAGDDLTYMAVS